MLDSKTNRPCSSHNLLLPINCHFFAGLKVYSNWPTYPQLYANGELIGGLDIVKVRTPH